MLKTVATSGSFGSGGEVCESTDAMMRVVAICSVLAAALRADRQQTTVNPVEKVWAHYKRYT